MNKKFIKIKNNNRNFLSYLEHKLPLNKSNIIKTSHSNKIKLLIEFIVKVSIIIDIKMNSFDIE